MAQFNMIVSGILLRKTPDTIFNVRAKKKPMRKFNIEEVPDKESLLKVLSGTSIDVPGRSKGRQTEHTEKWSVCYLLSTLASKNILIFPLSLEHIDKPDFILKMNGNLSGIEVTESIPPDYAKCCAMAERENPEAVIDMSLFKWDSTPKTTEQLRNIINSLKLTGEPWSGQSVELEWAHYINDAISVKLQKLNNTGYSEVPEYWVSIYDNLPLPNVHAGNATEILLETFSAQWKGDRSFSKIFIERGPIIIEIEDNIATNHVIVDLWS